MNKSGVAVEDAATNQEFPDVPCYSVSGCSKTPDNLTIKESSPSGPEKCGKDQYASGSLVTTVDLPGPEGTGKEKQRAGGGNGIPGNAGEEQQGAVGGNDLPSITQGSLADNPHPIVACSDERPQHASNSSCLNKFMPMIGGMKCTVPNGSSDASCGPKARKSTRSSCYNGVSKNKWTGRFEAHLWDGSFHNEGKRKGKLVYLGGYDSEEAAGRAHDLAAIKYWGSNAGTKLNFSVTEYWKDFEEMKSMSREEYVASLIRKSSCFSRGASIYRGVTRKKDGRWQARIGRIADKKDIYLGTYGK